jgi:DNA-binding NarL/FixJ family response regulator
MFKCFEDHVGVLGVCVDEPRCLGGYSPILFHPSYNARQALELMAARRFDLVLAGSALPDMETANFLRLMRDAHPTRNWAIVASPLTDEHKSLARTYGAIANFDAAPTTRQLTDLIARLRSQAIESVLNGTFVLPLAPPHRRAIAG